MAGTLATLVGIAGRLIMVLVDGPAAPHRNTVPEFALDVVLRPGTVAAVAVADIGTVASTPMSTRPGFAAHGPLGTLRLAE